jgi:DMSO/TMAO reductase YedYZ molybdopterin-dependent catalytic subunit
MAIDNSSPLISAPVTRRSALRVSGATLLGLSQFDLLQAQNKQAEPPSDALADQKPRAITALPLNSDGSAKTFTEGELTPVGDIGALFRNTGNKAPDIEYDPAKVHLKIRGNVTGKVGGLSLADLKKLPFTTQITKLQCGAPKPSGIVKWGGVRFADLCKMLDAQPMAQYVMFTSFDKYVTTEDITIATHPQVLLAWEMNGGPLPPLHGAPFRLVIPFRWGARNIKAIEEIRFTASSFGANNM